MRNMTVITFVVRGVLTAGLVLGVSACRSKMDVKTKSGGPAPAVLPADDSTDPGVDPGGDDGATPPVVIPTEKKSSLFTEGAKKYFQSREAIVIRIKGDLVAGADSFSVLNVTNSGTDDSKAVKLVDQDVVELGLRSAAGYALAEKDGGDLLVKFYPGTAAWNGKFFYGKTKANKLKVVAHDEDNPRFGFIEIFLSDFDIFDMAITSFENNVQIAVLDSGGYQFQGWLNTFSNSAVKAADGSVLVHGVFNIINPN